MTTTTAVCMCGTVWTSHQHDIRGTRTVRIPGCPACTGDNMATDNPLASADRVIDQLIDERDDARDALASAVQDYRQAKAEVRALTARLDAAHSVIRKVLDGPGQPLTPDECDAMRTATENPTPQPENDT